MQELHGLRYDYEQRGETCLVIWREDGIREEELSRIQMKMLQTGQVPRLLPFAAESVNGVVKLVYEIAPRRRMLQQALRADRLTLSIALQFLVSVTAMLEQCRSYMLRESGFLLEEQFLFVGADISDVYSVYLPLPRIEAPPVEQALKKLIARLEEALPLEERAPLARFAVYCDSGSFGVKALKRRIIEQLTTNVATSGVTAGSKKPSLSPGSGLLCDNRPNRHGSDPADVPLPVEEAVHEPSTVRGPLSLIIAVVGVTCALWLWNRYAIFPSTAMLHTAVGATLMLAAAWLLVRYAIDEYKWPTLARFRLKKVSRLLPYDDLEDEDEYGAGNNSEFAYLADSLSGPLLGAGSSLPNDEGEAGGTIAPSFPERQAANRADLRLLPDKGAAVSQVSPPFAQQPPASTSYSSEPVSKSPSSARAAAGSLGFIDAESYYASLREQTSLTHPAADATVLLRPAATPHSRPQAYLERGDEHPPRPIALSRSPFVIGRNGEHIEYRLEAPDVSRQHVEITEENGGYAAKDLGSTNGTLWNGERMVPFRVYPLQEGDCLTIAHVELTFRFVANARKTV